MNDERFDFSALDPSRDSEKFERRLRAIADAAEPQLAARRASLSVWSEITRLRRPLLAAATIGAILAIGTLVSVEAPTGETPQSIGIAEAVGVPSTVAEWVRSEEVPTTAELLVSLESEG